MITVFGLNMFNFNSIKKNHNFQINFDLWMCPIIFEYTQFDELEVKIWKL